MFALTGGELALSIFLFVLTWGAGLLPGLGERVGERIWAREPRRPGGE